MNNDEIQKTLRELNIEDLLSGIFIILGILSIYGDQIQKKYVITKDYKYQKEANNIFDLILLVTFILYIVFLYRSYRNYKNASENRKNLFAIKLLGSCFLMAGIICTIYFQVNNKKYVGVPEI